MSYPLLCWFNHPSASGSGRMCLNVIDWRSEAFLSVVPSKNKRRTEIKPRKGPKRDTYFGSVCVVIQAYRLCLRFYYLVAACWSSVINRRVMSSGFFLFLSLCLHFYRQIAERLFHDCIDGVIDDRWRKRVQVPSTKYIIGTRNSSCQDTETCRGDSKHFPWDCDILFGWQRRRTRATVSPSVYQL